MQRLLWLSLVGCSTEWEVSQEGDLRVLRATEVGTAAGTTIVDLTVEEGETSVLLTGSAPVGRLIFVNRVTGPDGEVLRASDYWDLDTNRVNAAFSSSVVTLNWPVDPAAEPLVPGRWRFELRVDAPSVPVDISAVLKRDADLSAGALRVRVVLAASLKDDADLRAGIDAAIALWQEQIYRSSDGGDPQIDVVVDASFDADLPSQLAAPGQGDASVYERLAAEKAVDEVNLVITDWVTSSTDVLGISGGIPGPLVATRNAAVTLSALSASEAAGRDRRFSDAEIELFAETMAHEVGHYLGLFHPAELPITGDVPPSWDALDDTEQCLSFEACMVTMGGNLMFPTPVCEDPFAISCASFVPQRSLTPLQVGLVQRYTGVR